MIFAALLWGCETGPSPDTDTGPEVGDSGRGLPWLTVMPGNRHACGIRSNGRAYCWGEGERGSAWTKDRVLSDVPARTDLVDLSLAVEPETNVACALTTDLRVACWGIHGDHEFSGPYVAMTVGEYHVFGLRGDASLDCYSATGGEPCIDYARLDNVEQFAADGSLVVAVGAGGELIGSSHSSTNHPSPEFPSGPWARVSRPSASWDWMCGIRTNGRLSCFGDVGVDSDGLDAPPDALVSDVCVNSHMGACALDLDGTPVCWGDDNDFEPSAGPFAKLTCGDGSWCGISPAGEATCWGYCDSGICDVPP